MNAPVTALRLGPSERTRGVRAVLGPTNTGKTHYAIERMLGHQSGMIGLPLRLLAREVYNRVVERVGPSAVALITGEEKIKPEAPRYWVSTVEAMPRDIDVSFVAVDEIQLAADLDRGHIFTDRLLNRRGREETLLIGASTMQRQITELLPGAPISSRPRLSKLSFAGDRKIARLPRRSAIVAFSVEEVYAIAEWIRRQRGGAAVVLGALSPRTRNAQVEIYQSGDVDYIVATDAIGMGLNLDVDHVAFASDRKFDGWQFRRLTAAEFGQIAGRAGRHMRDGTFGTTGRCPPFEEELVEALEDHRFDTVTTLQWRDTNLDFSSIATLLASLDKQPRVPGLSRAPLAEDQLVLDLASRDEKVQRETKTRADVERLWDACQIPDYRKLSLTAHAELVLSIYGFVIRAGYIPEDWLSSHVLQLDRVDGDLDTLAARIAQIRTWTFIANRPDWLRDPEHWQGVTRQVEDTLSDALHERLTQRFVDRRTSVLMRRLREKAMLEAEVTTSGDVLVEDQHVGHLSGFRFAPDPQADGEAAKALNAAAQKALASEIEGRAKRVHEAVDEAFVLGNDGIIRWLGEPVGQLAASDHLLQPRVTVLADEQLTGSLLEMAQRRLDLWLAQHVKKLLGPLFELEKGDGLEGIARGIAFRVAESLGVLERSSVAEDVKALPQEARATLRKFGVRFGAYHIYVPALLKPAPRAFAAELWALHHREVECAKGQSEVPHLAASGRTSFVADQEIPAGFYRAAGFHVCGGRAVRVDILERLADLIRPAVAYRPGVTPGDPPLGAANGDGFVVTVAMTSLVGCAGESFASILRALGYASEQRQGPAITVPLVAKAAIEPITPVQSSADAAAESVQASQADAVMEEVPSTAQEVMASEPVAESTPDLSAAIAEAIAEPVAAEASVVEPAETPSDNTTGDNIQSDVTPSDVTAGDVAVATAGSGDVAIAEAEVPLIEVWRPIRHRQPRREQRPQRNAFRGRPRAAHVQVPVPNGEAPAPANVPVPNGAEDHRADRTHRKSSRKEWAARAGGFEHAKGKKPEKRSSAAPGVRDRQRNGTWATTEKPKDRQPDPNSPFAKLLALKQQLENQSEKS